MQTAALVRQVKVQRGLLYAFIVLGTRWIGNPGPRTAGAQSTEATPPEQLSIRWRLAVAYSLLTK
jgi:hypothetical protein